MRADIDQDKSYWWLEGMGRFEFKMPGQAVLDCHHQGACDEDVEYWLPKAREWLKDVSDEDLNAALKEYGAWDEEEREDRDDNIRRLIWIAAGDIQEDDKAEEEE